MSRVTDSSGKTWALMSCRDSAGRIYIRAYRNRWDPEKKRSFVEARLQVGRLQQDGSVSLSDRFEETFPDYRGKQWFWADRELVPAEEFRAQFPVERQAKDISWSDESIRVGVTYAAWTLAEKAEIFGDLVEIFGERDARTLLALAIYKLDGGGAMMNFEDWVAQVWLPEVEPVDGRRLSELFARMSVTKMENYFKRRYDRAVKRSAEGVTLSFDSTSISTYSGTIEDAAWGHAKQNPELRQVNLMVVCDHETGDIVFTHVYDGSINDRGILSTIYLRMQAAGLSLKNNVLVTDRGFQSIYNTQLALNLDLKYIQFLNLNEGGVQTQLRRKLNALMDPVAHWDPRLEISGLTVPDHWTATTENGTSVSVKGHLHLYRDAMLAQMLANELHRDVRDVLDIKNEDANAIRRFTEEMAREVADIRKKDGDVVAEKFLRAASKKQPKMRKIDEALWQRVRPFLIENRRAKDDQPVWSVNYNELKAAVEFKGCHAIRTNTETDCFKALKTYRERQVIEQGFDQLKNEVGGSRFECTQSSYKGKLFVYCLAQALRMMMLCTVRRAQADTGLKLPRQSLRKALIQLQSVQATKHRATNTFIVKAVAKRHRDLFSLLGITKLPKRLDRFS